MTVYWGFGHPLKPYDLGDKPGFKSQSEFEDSRNGTLVVTAFW